MQKYLAVLMTVSALACGSASKAGPKTSNPPLTPDRKTAPVPPKSAGPAEKPPIVQDGLTLKFTALGFQLTMTPAPWKGNYRQEADGTSQIVFSRPDVPAVLLIIPVRAEKTDAKAIAESQQALASREQGLTATPVAVESGGRYAFTADRVVDGEASRTYLAVTPHPTLADAYLISVAMSAVDKSDVFLREVRIVLDSIAPLR